MESRLNGLREAVEYPPTPDIAASVARRLRSDGPAAARRPWLPLPRALVAILAGTLVVAAGVFAAVPGVRDAVLDLIDLRGVTIETTTAPAPAPPTDEPDYGRETTLPAGRADVRFEPLLPAGMGPPDAVFIRTEAPGGELTLVYGDMAISQFRGDLVPEYFAKLVPAGTAVERLRVGGSPAAWFSEAPHFFAYRGPGGAIIERTLRPAANVLLVQRGRLLIRIEGAGSRAKAIEVARSLDGRP